MWEDCEEECKAEAETWGMSGFPVRVLSKGGSHERDFFFKELVTTCSSREPGEMWTKNEKDTRQNRPNDRDEFLFVFLAALHSMLGTETVWN